MLTPFLSHLFATGGTLNLSGNRISEGPADTLLSLWGLSQIGHIVTANQMGHQFFVRNNHFGGNATQVGNQVLFLDESVLGTVAVGSGRNFFEVNVSLFFHLLFRPVATVGEPPPPPP